MPPTWASIAEGWHVTLLEFLGKRTSASLPAFDPFERIYAQYRSFSVDQFSKMPVPGCPGFQVHRFKSKVRHERDSVVLLRDGARLGFIARNQYGSDTVSLHPSVRGKALAAPFILATMALRALGRREPIDDVVRATRELFNGGSYSDAGLRAVCRAHRLAVERALAAGHPVPAHVQRSCTFEAARHAPSAEKGKGRA